MSWREDLKKLIVKTFNDYNYNKEAIDPKQVTLGNTLNSHNFHDTSIKLNIDGTEFENERPLSANPLHFINTNSNKTYLYLMSAFEILNIFKDIADTGRTYDANRKKYISLDALQIWRGLKNTGGAMIRAFELTLFNAITAIYHIASAMFHWEINKTPLSNIGNNILNTGKHILLTAYNTVAVALYMAIKLTRGLTQIATAPLALLRIPLRLFITWCKNRKSARKDPTSNAESEAKAVEAPKVEQSTTAVTRQFISPGTTDAVTPLLDEFKPITKDTLSAAIKNAKPDNLVHTSLSNNGCG